MKNIGPTFGSELAAAGLAGLPCAWSEFGTYTIYALTDAQQQTFLQVLDAHDPTKPAVPQEISDRQFFQQLAVMTVVTEDEAIAAVANGTLPASMVALVNSLPAEQQFPTNMLLKGATQFVRSHPMVPVLGQLYGWDAAQLDALWIAAALL